MKIYTFARVCNESSKAELCVPAWQVEEKMEDVTRPVQSVFSLKEMRWSKPDQEALIGVLQARQIEKKATDGYQSQSCSYTSYRIVGGASQHAGHGL